MALLMFNNYEIRREKALIIKEGFLFEMYRFCSKLQFIFYMGHKLHFMASLNVRNPKSHLI